MEQTAGFEPATEHRQCPILPTELRLRFASTETPPVGACTRSELLRIDSHRRHSAGEFTAARSLRWQGLPCGLCAVAGTVKNKEARNPLRESGPLVRELGRYAVTRCLHPGASDPHTLQGYASLGRTAAGTRCVTADSSWTKYHHARPSGRTRTSFPVHMARVGLS